MSEIQNQPVVDIQKIMEEIKEEAKRRGLSETIPSFEEIPIPKHTGELSAHQFSKNIESRLSDVDIPPVFPVETGNSIKRFYKKTVCKLIRCATFPMTLRVTKTNWTLRDSLIDAAKLIEAQQEQIDELEGRILQMERMLRKEKV